MESVATFIDSLNTGHWIAIAAILMGSFFGSFTVLNYLAGRRERKLRTYETTPEVKATINRKRYDGGWRSVQLHIIAPPEQQNFQVNNWHITHARLVRPWFGAVLARAENNDYATGVFFPENPLRALDGKADGRPQRFALGFSFISKKRTTGAALPNSKWPSHIPASAGITKRRCGPLCRLTLNSPKHTQR